MSNGPRITVIIPTRERAATLAYALKTVTSQDYENLEIIVSDNASQDATADVVRAANDPRIRYVNTGRRLSMSHNWEFALSHVSDGWVSVIGDDDGIPSGGVPRAAALIEETKTLALRSDPCGYRWPAVTGQPFGWLSVPLGSGYVVRDCAVWLEKLMRGSAFYTDLPMLYHGSFIHTSLLQELKQRTGAVFKSSQPDIYTSVAIANIAKTYVFASEPLGIAGVSRNSTGASVFYSARNSSISQEPKLQFLSEENIPFHPDIAFDGLDELPLSMQALVYESQLQSAALRPAPLTKPAEQLVVFLANTGGDPATFNLWTKTFAARHGLSLEEAQRRVRRKRIQLFPSSVPGRIRRGINTTTVGSISLPIRDVYEASIAVAAIRERPPGRLQNIASTARRAIRKLTS